MIKENFDSYDYSSKEFNYAEVLIFIESPPPFISILPKDTLEITIQIQNDTLFQESINYDEFNYDIIKNKMKLVLNSDDNRDDIDEFNCKIKYQIKKNSSLDTFSIYNFQVFMDYVLNSTNHKTLTNILNLFKKYSANEKKVYFNNHEGFIIDTNLFTSAGPDNLKEVSNEQRTKKYDAWNFFSNNQNLAGFGLLPEDFINLEYSTYESQQINDFQLLFKKISDFLMLSFLVDFVRLDEDILTLRINERYRRFKESIDFNLTIIENEDTLKKIYEWVFFSSKNEIEDRLEITKNVLSRKLSLNNNILNLKNDSYYAIIDAHKIYLKENVVQYFDVKKEVANLITDITTKNSEMIKNMSSAFKISSGTLVTYFISLFIFNSLSSNEMEVFNKSNYLISITLLILSLLSLKLTLKQTDVDEKLLIKNFTSIKENYREDFDSTHLDELFSNQLLLDNTKSLNDSKKLFKNYWLAEVFILFFMITLIVFHKELLYLLIISFEFFINFFNNLSIK